ncbi:transcription initiation factor IIA large subunit-like isoform X2 [Magnolia sinica]|uniref:transcription initiation factor IIA large subunit-like isoform X2 n=1 Tax=Magnolia sinica TaxID=86752 RepID=UPI002657B194|nr:transcription initiation factor IIA large subunit-like isoform X2 [Magnolia sinica]
MSTSSVSSVYLHVVDSVVSKLREEFLNEGVDDSVLNELQGLWELKMLQCGAVQGPIERSSVPRATIPAPVHDLNVPYEGPEEYETPTAEMLFPPTPLQTPIQTPLPVEPGGYQYYPAGPSPAGPSEFGTIPDTGAAAELKTARPAPYMQQPSPWMTQRPLGVDVNVAYEEAREEEEGGGISQPPMKDFFMLTAGKRKREDYPPHLLPGGYIPQQDGSGDISPNHSLQEKVLLGENPSNKEHSLAFNDRLNLQARKKADATIASMIKMKQYPLLIPQQDGFNDVYDDGGGNEDYNTPSYYDPLTPHNVGTPKPTKNEALEDDEPPLNEDDDDDDLDDLEQGDEEPSTNHLVLAQFEKANGEFDF